jgi:hypothetical protein
VLNASEPLSFDKDILSKYIPLKADGDLDSCKRFQSPFQNSSIQSCDGLYVFDTSVYEQSRVFEVISYDKK